MFVVGWWCGVRWWWGGVTTWFVVQVVTVVVAIRSVVVWVVVVVVRITYQRSGLFLNLLVSVMVTSCNLNFEPFDLLN